MKKIKKAAALKYENNYDAPIVTAAGMGYMAEKIIETAKNADVPIVYDDELTDFLTSVDVDNEIPPELYEAVAKVIAYVMDADKKFKGR